jgi:hypothetical protein
MSLKSDEKRDLSEKVTVSLFAAQREELMHLISTGQAAARDTLPRPHSALGSVRTENTEKFLGVPGNAHLAR